MRTTTRRSLLAERTLFSCGKLSMCSIAGMAGYARKSRVVIFRLSLSLALIGRAGAREPLLHSR